jgi:hypothetical protein
MLMNWSITPVARSRPPVNVTVSSRVAFGSHLTSAATVSGLLRSPSDARLAPAGAY